MLSPSSGNRYGLGSRRARDASSLEPRQNRPSNLANVLVPPDALPIATQPTPSPLEARAIRNCGPLSDRLKEDSESEASSSSDDPGLSIEPDAIWARVRCEGLAQAFERALRRGGIPRADHFVRTRETADPF
jgi:hypothetical protein